MRRISRAMLARLKSSFPYRLYQKYSADQAGKQAVLIAWTGLLAFFPLTLALLALVGLLIREPEAMQSVQRAMLNALPSGAAGAVQTTLSTTRESTGELGIIGLGGLVLIGSALFGTMADAFNVAYRVPGRGLLRQHLMAISMIFIFSALLVLALLASGVANVLAAAVQGAAPANVPQLSLLVSLAAWVVAFLTGFVLFLTIYRVVPNAGQGFREVWPGALFAAGGFFLLQQVFPLYLRYFGGATSYAIFGLFFLVMIWFYLIAQLLMIGVELNAYLARPALRVIEPAEPATAGRLPAWLAAALLLGLTGWLIARPDGARLPVRRGAA